MTVSFKLLLRLNILFSLLLMSSPLNALAQTARITEEIKTIKTYPYSEPNPIPIIGRDPRLYPYHSFEGYSTEAIYREWKVIHLENDLIEVFVLPEAGGKVWGAIVKKTGNEFIYRNEVIKFRNVSLRGPWTSGGIEFNFGVIGHTPATAAPVDYIMKENADGSVSVIVGTMDLPSRTHWRVEVRLPADKAYFETNVLWTNPTELEQPYYNWMTGAAFAQQDLEMSIPGNISLTHPGEETPWPIDKQGRNLAGYANNKFDGHKSYHVVGEMNDFFGGYYKEDNYGFGHWSRHEEMPGQKLWLWALSRHGGIWEDLLTDTDGQYIEFQAGRMLNQYQPGDHINPISKSSFNPGSTDRWTETWFPLEGTGGLTDASREGAMYVKHKNGKLTISINTFSNLTDNLNIYSAAELISTTPISFKALEAVTHTIDLSDDDDYRIVLASLDLDYSSNPKDRELTRLYGPDESARTQIPANNIKAFEARELLKARRYNNARKLFEEVVKDEPWHRDALLGLADLNYRSGQYEAALFHTSRLLQLDAYDADANFMAGNIYRSLNMINNARDAFGWSARSMKYRSVANVQLSEIMAAQNKLSEAKRYAEIALDYDRNNISALQLLSMISRHNGNANMATGIHNQISAIDPLSHFVKAEQYLLNQNRNNADALNASINNEYPDQTILELAIDYHRRGDNDAANALLSLNTKGSNNPLLRLWSAKINNNASLLSKPPELDFIFPFRRETLSALEWATRQNNHWSWSYLYSLNLWALDRENEATKTLYDLKDIPNHAPMYMVRGYFKEQQNENAEQDFRHAVELDSHNRILHSFFIQYLQRQQDWQAALEAGEKARARFPNDFNLDLLHVKSLNNLGKANEALEILSNTHVLPSENARESHILFEQAHAIVAMNAFDKSDYSTAINHLQSSMQWPEHLGLGKPYEPEQRLQEYLIAVAKVKQGEPKSDHAEQLNHKDDLEKRADDQLLSDPLTRQIINRALSFRN